MAGVQAQVTSNLYKEDAAIKAQLQLARAVGGKNSLFNSL